VLTMAEELLHSRCNGRWIGKITGLESHPTAKTGNLGGEGLQCGFAARQQEQIPASFSKSQSSSPTNAS